MLPSPVPLLVTFTFSRLPIGSESASVLSALKDSVMPAGVAMEAALVTAPVPAPAMI